MTKKLISVIIVLLFTYLVVCAGRSELQKELKAAERKGYTIRLGTRYDADGVEELIFVNVYSDEKEIKRSYFDVDGVPDGYTLIEYHDSGRKWKEARYDSKNRLSYETKYEYDVRNNMITQHDYQYDYYYDTRLQIHEIYHYEYDDQGRKISMWYGIGEDTDEAIVVDGYFGPTYYFYDEEGKLIREETCYTYTVYEYEGSLLVNEASYVDEGDNVFYGSGTEYEYDEEGRLIKSTYFEEVHECVGYTTYEYDEAGRLIKSTYYEEEHQCVSYTTYEYP